LFLATKGVLFPLNILDLLYPIIKGYIKDH
jgi:hypothetical protein